LATAARWMQRSRIAACIVDDHCFKDAENQKSVVLAKRERGARKPPIQPRRCAATRQ
jgi:hypothetical protein